MWYLRVQASGQPWLGLSWLILLHFAWIDLDLESEVLKVTARQLAVL